MTMTLQLTDTTQKTTAEILTDLRRTPLFCQLVPQEAGIGFPIPLRKEGKVYGILPCFGFNATSEPGKTAIFPPLATITINWANQVPVEYVNLRFRHPAPELNWEEQIGTFPHPAIAHMSVGEYQEKRRQLLAMYDVMFAKLTSGDAFDPDWSAEFSSLLTMLLEPSLIPYYRVLGGKFCEQFLVV